MSIVGNPAPFIIKRAEYFRPPSESAVRADDQIDALVALGMSPSPECCYTGNKDRPIIRNMPLGILLSLFHKFSVFLLILLSIHVKTDHKVDPCILFMEFHQEFKIKNPLD